MILFEYNVLLRCLVQQSLLPISKNKWTNECPKFLISGTDFSKTINCHWIEVNQTY